MHAGACHIVFLCCLCITVYSFVSLPFISLFLLFPLFYQRKGGFCIKIKGVGMMHMKGVLLSLHLPFRVWQAKLTSPEGLQQYK